MDARDAWCIRRETCFVRFVAQVIIRTHGREDPPPRFKETYGSLNRPLGALRSEHQLNRSHVDRVAIL